VPKGRRNFPGVWGFVKVLVFNLDSTRVAGGTERATDGGLLGGALEGARATGGFAGEAGVDLSSLYKILDQPNKN